MGLKEKNIHIITEFLAVTILVPYFLYFLYKYGNKISLLDKIFISIFIILTILIDGYLFITWFN
jgi:hypothetical protein